MSNKVPMNKISTSKISIILIDKRGNVKEQKMLKIDESELYKKAGFKHPDNFSLRHIWNTNVHENICVYAKTEGTNGSLNKYTFPPPLDEVSFYGSAIVLCKKNNEYRSITIDEWSSIYSSLSERRPDDDDDDRKHVKKTASDEPDSFELEYESELSEEEYI